MSRRQSAVSASSIAESEKVLTEYAVRESKIKISKAAEATSPNSEIESVLKNANEAYFNALEETLRATNNLFSMIADFAFNPMAEMAAAQTNFVKSLETDEKTSAEIEMTLERLDKSIAAERRAIDDLMTQMVSRAS